MYVLWHRVSSTHVPLRLTEVILLLTVARKISLLSPNCSGHCYRTDFRHAMKAIKVVTTNFHCQCIRCNCLVDSFSICQVFNKQLIPFTSALAAGLNLFFFLFLIENLQLKRCSIGAPAWTIFLTSKDLKKNYFPIGDYSHVICNNLIM